MKHKTLSLYVPFLEGGYEDAGRVDLAGYTLISDERLYDLEAAETEALEEARLNGMGTERELALMAKLEAAEKERDDVAQQLVQSEIGKREISEAHDAVTGRLSDLADENTALRAKVNEMEQQKPIGEMLEVSPHNYELRWYRPVPFGAKLYTLPGAKGEEE